MKATQIISCLLNCMAFAVSPAFAQKGDAGELLFQSGFEKGTTIVSTLTEDKLRGADRSVVAPNDWSKFAVKGGYPDAGQFSLFYEGGDSLKRKSRLVPDPKDAKNTVLRFTVFEPNAVKSPADTIPYKTRAQMQVSGAKGITKYYQSVRMYLPSASMNVLKKYPQKLTWYSLAEFWNNAAWGSVPKFPYRLTVGLSHEVGEQNAFYFHFSCDKYQIQFQEDGKTPEKYIPTSIKSVVDRSFAIPFDTWITVEYYFQEGNWTAGATRPAGHFYMSVKPDGGRKQVLFNERVATIHPDATDPDGLTAYHPLKFYTSKQVAAFMKTNNTPLEILWDDLKIYSGKIPNDAELKAALVKP